MSTFRQKVQARSDWGKPDPEEEAPVQGRKAGKKARASAGQSTGRKPGRRAAPAPVTSHRLFPAFAALWLAALFGLGSLAISSDVLGRLVTAIGLPALVPAAAPPLGFTAHLLVALALTAVGAGLGLLVGLRLRPQAGSQNDPQEGSFAVPAPVAAAPLDTGVPKVRARDAHPDAPPRRPLVLTEAFADQVEPAILDTDAPAEPLLRQKPGQARDFTPDAAPAAAETESWFPVYTPGGAGAIEPLDLASLDLANVDAEIDMAQTSGEAALFASPAAEAQPEPAETEIAHFEVGAQDEPAAEAIPEIVATEAAVPESAWEAPRPTLLAATPQVPSGFTLPIPDSGKLLAGETWSPVAGAPLENLGLVQLIERLALAIAAHKTAGDAGPQPPSLTPPSDGLAPEGELAAEPAAEVETLGEAQVSADTEYGADGYGADGEADAAHETDIDMPAVDPSAPFARPIECTSADSDLPAISARDAILHRLGAAGALGPVATGPGPFSRPPEVPATPEAQVDAVVQLRQPDWHEAVENPVPVPATVQAPALAAAPASLPAETDEALRSALATLQRMSARG